jgi:phage protein D
MVRVLLEAGADINLKGGYHGDGLQAAARYGRAESTQTLLDAWADPTAHCRVYGSALKAARERRHPHVTQMLEIAIEKWNRPHLRSR